MTDQERFNKYTKLDEATGCILWVGGKNSTYSDYGSFVYKGKATLAHRVAWLLAGKEIPVNKPNVLHNCPGGDNPACVNVEHLWVGTNKQNNEDKAIKNRGTGGSKYPYGVSPHLTSGRFKAAIGFGRKLYYLGHFDTADEASAAAVSAKEAMYFGARPTGTH